MARTPSPIAGVRLRARTDADLGTSRNFGSQAGKRRCRKSIFWRGDRGSRSFAETRSGGAITLCAFDGLGPDAWIRDIDPATAYLDQLAVAQRRKAAARKPPERARRLRRRAHSGCQSDIPRAAFYERKDLKRSGRHKSAFRPKTWRLRLPQTLCNP